MTNEEMEKTMQFILEQQAKLPLTFKGWKKPIKKQRTRVKGIQLAMHNSKSLSGFF